MNYMSGWIYGMESDRQLIIDKGIKILREGKDVGTASGIEYEVFLTPEVFEMIQGLWGRLVWVLDNEIITEEGSYILQVKPRYYF